MSYLTFDPQPRRPRNGARVRRSHPHRSRGGEQRPVHHRPPAADDGDEVGAEDDGADRLPGRDRRRPDRHGGRRRGERRRPRRAPGLALHHAAGRGLHDHPRARQVRQPRPVHRPPRRRPVARAPEATVRPAGRVPAGRSPPGKGTAMFFLPTDMRIADADREAAVEFIKRHYAAGRLSDAEFSARVDAAYAARYESQLDALTWDLPDLPPERALARRPLGARVAPAAAVGGVAVGGGAVGGGAIASLAPPELWTGFLALGLPLLMMLAVTVAPIALPILALM